MFVEIKTESLEKFGIEFVAQAVMNTISPLDDRCVPISYSDAVLQHARISGATAIGWVIKEYDDRSLYIARNLSPQYLFCNYKKLPPAPANLWSGPWMWALYELTDPVLALELVNRGVEMIETMEIGEMLQHPLIKGRPYIDD